MNGRVFKATLFHLQKSSLTLNGRSDRVYRFIYFILCWFQTIHFKYLLFRIDASDLITAEISNHNSNNKDNIIKKQIFHKHSYVTVITAENCNILLSADVCLWVCVTWLVKTDCVICVITPTVSLNTLICCTYDRCQRNFYICNNVCNV